MDVLNRSVICNAMLVQTHSLTKRYRQVTALDDCSFEVQQGEVFGLLGPNGAGKTTLLRLLLGYLQPTSGSAIINDLDCQKQTVQVRHYVSYLPGDARLFRNMRGREALKFFAEVRPGGDVKRSYQFAERLELDLVRKVAYMSTGMRQKLALAATMASETPLLILDEPTANLDPTVRATVLKMVAEAKQQGRTVIFSSHVLSEVEEVCDRAVILRSGRLVHTQVMSDLRRRHRITATMKGELPAAPEEVRQQLSITRKDNDRVMIETPGELAPLLGWLSTLNLAEVHIEPVGLRAVYDKYHSE